MYFWKILGLIFLGCSFWNPWYRSRLWCGWLVLGRRHALFNSIFCMIFPLQQSFFLWHNGTSCMMDSCSLHRNVNAWSDFSSDSCEKYLIIKKKETKKEVYTVNDLFWGFVRRMLVNWSTSAFLVVSWTNCLEKVASVQVPGHAKIPGNEYADWLSKRDKEKMKLVLRT